MIIEDILSMLAEYIGFVYGEAVNYLGPTGAQIALMSIAIALYVAVVGSFYVRLSKKEIFKVNTQDLFKGQFTRGPSLLDSITFLLKYSLIFPIILVLWSGFLAFFLTAISKVQSAEIILVTTMSIVVATRVLAYYSEDISVDLAKILPLALLGIVLVDPGQISEEVLISRLYDMFNLGAKFIPSFVAFVVVEWVLVLMLFVKRMVFRVEDKEEYAKS